MCFTLASNLLATLMDRYPAILYIGAGILGKVGGEMILTDPWLVRTLHPSKAILYSAEAVAVILIIAAGRILSNTRSKWPGDRTSAGS